MEIIDIGDIKLDIALRKNETLYSMIAAQRYLDDSNREREDDEIEDGTIYITSKRFIFKGELGTLTIALGKVLSCECENFEFTISPSNGPAQTFHVGEILPESIEAQIMAIISGDTEIPAIEENPEWYDDQQQNLDYEQARQHINNRAYQNTPQREETESSGLTKKLTILLVIAFAIIIALCAYIFFKLR
ncbi:MAG: hypothetical protein AB9917_05505 [Negativicutes bacterium]